MISLSISVKMNISRENNLGNLRVLFSIFLCPNFYYRRLRLYWVAEVDERRDLVLKGEFQREWKCSSICGWKLDISRASIGIKIIVICLTGNWWLPNVIEMQCNCVKIIWDSHLSDWTLRVCNIFIVVLNSIVICLNVRIQNLEFQICARWNSIIELIVLFCFVYYQY